MAHTGVMHKSAIAWIAIKDSMDCCKTATNHLKMTTNHLV